MSFDCRPCVFVSGIAWLDFTAGILITAGNLSVSYKCLTNQVSFHVHDAALRRELWACRKNLIGVV